MTLGTSARLVVTLVAGLACTSVAPSAVAEDGARKVGSSYVIRFRHLDLDQPADRRALLEQIEGSAADLCQGEPAKLGRDACAETAIASSLKSAPGRVRRAVKTARLERDGELQAHR